MYEKSQQALMRMERSSVLIVQNLEKEVLRRPMHAHTTHAPCLQALTVLNLLPQNNAFLLSHSLGLLLSD